MTWTASDGDATRDRGPLAATTAPARLRARADQALPGADRLDQTFLDEQALARTLGMIGAPDDGRVYDVAIVGAGPAGPGSPPPSTPRPKGCRWWWTRGASAARRVGGPIGEGAAVVAQVHAYLAGVPVAAD